VWLDDQELTDMAATDFSTHLAAGNATVNIGARVSAPLAAGPGIDVWVDEVAINGSRIGCTR
jgi:hypothetical protein